MLGKLFILAGIVLLTIGLALQFTPGALAWFGRLPGDISIERDGVRVFIPITSMIILSLALTVILNLLFRR